MPLITSPRSFPRRPNCPNPKLGKFLRRGLATLFSLGLISYSGLCLLLFVRQKQMIVNPAFTMRQLPSDPYFGLPYETVWLPVSPENPSSAAKLHAWWILAQPGQRPTKTLIYFSGRGSNKSYNLSRMEGLWRLGFSILMIDYRGVGLTPGPVPGEAQMYTDARAAWHYVTQTRRIPASQVLIYGESLGGAVALDLAVNQPGAGGLILQSTFTSIADWARQHEWLRWFPAQLLLTERFDSIGKVNKLQMPVLFLHGEADPIVPVWMSQRLYAEAPQPKRLLLIPGKGHNSIYVPGEQSYLTAIQEFFQL